MYFTMLNERDKERSVMASQIQLDHMNKKISNTDYARNKYNDLAELCVYQQHT